MKIKEVIADAVQMPPVKPTVVAKQDRVDKLVAQRASSESQQQPTELDKVAAMMQHAALKKRTDANYATQLNKQAAIANSVVMRGK